VVFIVLLVQICAPPEEREREKVSYDEREEVGGVAKLRTVLLFGLLLVVLVLLPLLVLLPRVVVKTETREFVLRRIGVLTARASSAPRLPPAQSS
jgi:hypothetical protein